MSTFILNGLFQQIMHSEEKVRERCCKLRALNNEIQSYEIKIQDGEEETKSLQGKLVMEIQCLVDEELNLKWLVTREETLRQKLRELEEPISAKEQEMEKLEGKSVSERAKFERAVQDFVSKYDLAGQGQQKRESQAKLELNLLKQKAQNLSQDLEQARQQQQEAAGLRKERANQEAMVAKSEEEYRVLSNQLDALKNHSQLLDKDKHKATNKKQTDPEFRRLTAELEALKDNTMEAVCEALSQELKGLQQVHLKKELQKQKNLQKKQQQHYRAHAQYWSYGPPTASSTRPQATQSRQKSKFSSLRDKGKQWRYEVNKQTLSTSKPDCSTTTVDLTEDDYNDDDFIDDDMWIAEA